MQRYLVKQGMHLGPIRQNIRPGQVIEWSQDSGRMTIDGGEVRQSAGADDSGGLDVDTFRGMRALQVLSERNPSNPPIVLLGDAPDESKVGSTLKTDTLCLLPILGCVQTAEEFLGLKDPEWNTLNDKQKQFIERFRQQWWLNPTALPELRCKADKDVEVINTWLREEGFDIQLDPILDGFAVASILKLLVEWLKLGKKRTLVSKRDGKTYPSVKLEKGVALFRDLDVHPFPVARIETKSGDIVKMAIADVVPNDVFGLFDLTQKLHNVRTPYHNRSGVMFPMIEMDVRPDISWIEGMAVEGWYIAQALQQTKFRMNERGAKVESAVAMSLCRGASAEPEPYVIDRPFVIWIERAGMPIPFFMAVLAEDVWREPKEL